MDDLELRLVRYFTVVAEHGTFGRAAEALLVAQPSLSRQMQRLEAQVGARLLDRTPQGTHLTEAGRAFLPHALALLRTAQTGVWEARAASGPASMTVGYTGHLLITPVVRELRRRHPAALVQPLNVELTESGRALRDHRVDALVAVLPFPVAGLDVEVLREVLRVLVVPAGHRLAGRASVALADFADEPLIRSGEPEWDRFWRLDPRPDGSPAPDGPLVGSIADKYELVADGQALVLAPATLTGLRPDLVAVPVRDVAPVQVVAATRSGEDGPLVRTFREAARTCFGRARLSRVGPA